MASTLTNDDSISFIGADEKQQFVPLSDYVILQGKCEHLEQQREALNTEVLQLREVIKGANSGILKASDILEGIIETRDQKIITDLFFKLQKHHPMRLVVKYKGNAIMSIEGE